MEYPDYIEREAEEERRERLHDKQERFLPQGSSRVDAILLDAHEHCRWSSDPSVQVHAVTGHLAQKIVFLENELEKKRGEVGTD